MRTTRSTVVLALALAGLAIGAPALAAARVAPRAVPATDWTTYHHDALRSAAGTVHGTYTKLAAKFTWHLPAKGDTVFASPLVVGHVAFVTTLGDRVYAVSTQTGKTLWSRALGTAYVPPAGVCGNIGPKVGIVSTPVIDESRHALFVVGALGNGAGAHHPIHTMFGLSLATGKVLVHVAIDPPGQNPIYLLQRASLALDGGRVVVGFGGNWGDCGTYHGWVESVAETGVAPIQRYEVASGAGQGRGAVWMGGGAPTVDAAGNVYVATGNGNGASAGAMYDHSDAVLKLSSSMKLLDWFAPTSWWSDNAADLDLGSGAPQLLANGLVVQVGKTQTAYVLHASSLGHLGGSAATFTVCSGAGQANGGDAIAGSLVIVPCEGGLNAVRVTTSPPGGSVVWTSGVAGSPPIVAAGLVWVIAGSTGGSTLYALDPATGAMRLQTPLGGEKNHFPTPAAGDNLVVVATSGTLVAYAPK